MTDPAWIVCPHCGLKHRRRPDAQCPKCHQGVDGAPSAHDAAPRREPGGTGGLTVCNMDQTRVVITDDAIIELSPKGRGAMVGGIAGGALGYLIGAAIEHAVEKRSPKAEPSPPRGPAASLAAMDRARLSTVAELPPEITGDPAFPGVAPETVARIYPRCAISAVRLSIWDGLHLTLSPPGPVAELGIAADGQTKVGLAAWHIGKVRGHLERAGYRLTG